MGRHVLGLDEIDRTQVAVVGGKAANLGALAQLAGVRVPPGFCVTSEAFRRTVAEVPSIDGRLDALRDVDPRDREAIRSQSAAIRSTLGGVAIPDDVVAEIVGALHRIGGDVACAVRSSATAEDMPSASFAGQHDSYLGVVGAAAVLDHVRRCWASLFTERAVTYRIRNGLDHRAVHMAVVVQRMVLPRASGVAFTADPVTSDRKVTAIEATPGLGDALVAGLVDAELHTVRDGAVVGTELAGEPTLSEAEVLELAGLAREIEAHLGCPQDIEWCLDDDGFHVVQSRPITTLFPVPPAPDGENHVYVSVGHQQMMTDAMTPLGLSVWQLTTPRPMAEAGSRLFVDVTPALASRAGRDGFLEVMGRSDPLIRDALETVCSRDFVPVVDGPGLPMHGAPPTAVDVDPALVPQLIERSRSSIDSLRRDIEARSGAALVEFVIAHIAELQRTLFEPRSLEVILAAMDATSWLNEHMQEWLGETNAADTITQSVPHNVTSEMGLALLDVADAIRPHPEVVAFLRDVDVDDDDFLDRLPVVDGGREACDAFRAFLREYGMRCVGEIDITRPRWSERPGALVPMVLTDVDTFEAGEAARRFERGRRRALAHERDLLARLRALPDGTSKAEETEGKIRLVRTYIGYREHPKYGMVSCYALYKQGLLREVRRLVERGVLRDEEDAFFLRIQELLDAVRTEQVDHDLIRRRREDFRSHLALVPPRVVTSDGEAIAGSYRRGDVPAGALVGLPVSRGTVEGRARVISDMADADLEAGDILVTAHTDPSWSPLFVAAAGLVTEVGGRMTHGAVVAREYGLPAVVGVERATQRIRDGQRIRVDGTDGYVEIVSEAPTRGRW